MRHTAIVLLAATAAWTHPLANTPLISAREQVFVEGVGHLRSLNSPIVEAARTIETDNGRIIVARISTEGSPAARLLIRNMALPAGAELYLYGRDENGNAGKVYGPFTLTGPLFSGEFWTDSIEGTEIVLELRAASASGNLPFDVVGLSLVDAPSEPLPAASDTEEIRTSSFRGLDLTHAVRDGLAVYEGDILLGAADELSAPSPQKGRRGAVAITGSQYRWPGGIVPYAIDPAVPNQTRITAAISHWNNALTGYVKLVPRTSETSFVNFVRASSASTCSSYIGRIGSAQPLQTGDYCTTGNLIHEIGHAAGLWHEQSREDRDTHVKILWANIQTGKEYNFSQQISDGDDIDAYNFGSIMHYPANAFSANGLPTIETIPAGIPIGQRSALNAGDIAAVKSLYPLAAPAPSPGSVAVSIASNPKGMPVAIDGVAVTAPVTMNWVSGSVHRIAALNPAAVNGVRQSFSRWSDGGAIDHQITVPSTSTTLRADYVTAYLLAATAAPVGSVAKSPATADGYYTAGATVQLNATAPGGYCFTSWTGLVSGTPAVTSVSMVNPRTVQASFQTGAVTASPVSISAGKNSGSYQISVAATSGCAWTAVSSASWIAITSGGSGAGPGVMTVAVEAKKGGNKRTGQIAVGGSVITITQQ